MKTRASLLCLVFLSLLTGPAGGSRVTPFKPVTGAFFGLSVADLTASKAWYMEKLGLEVVFEVPRQGGIAVAVLEGGGLIVELIQQDGSLPRPVPPGSPQQQGFTKAGMVVKDLDGVVAELRARGAEIAFGPFPATEQQRANVLVRDNSGNLIQLFGQ